MSENKKANRLINEKSPYLMQHAFNPVDWYAWGEEAFEKAKIENKPIFLSIGYSTCHWCHVMEHESFEDNEVAELMNEVFVSIKVDREERPDIDNIYMTVCQMMTGGGGWPLTIVMTPDKRPFFSGTYFPKENRFGRMGFKELIKQIDSAWKNKREEIENSADNITYHIKEFSSERPGKEITPVIMQKAYENFFQRFDKEKGGFNSSPKFPSPQNLLFLLRYWKRTGERTALEMVDKTLTEMRRGGIYDQVGFGFHRYSTDKNWLLPHFEKMLYDQAMLIMAYTELYQATKKPEHRQTTEEIIEYVLRDMTSPEGAFYSAEDADSEGEEGKFYVWTVEQVKETLGETDGEFFAKVFSFKSEGNFAEESTRQFTGANIPHLQKSIEDIAKDFDMSAEDFSNKIEDLRTKLFNKRENRIHPYKDDKILTDWNGLMIAALSKAAGVFQNVKFSEAAERTVEFFSEKMIDAKGRLFHRYRDGEAGLSATIDDYVFMIWGLIELYQSTYKIEYLKKALQLQAKQDKHYWDEIYGGYFFTADDAEELLVRKKEIYDGAYPSGNSTAMLNLLKLGRLTSNIKFEEMASRLSKAFSETVEKSPTAFCQLLCGADFAFGPAKEIIILGDKEDDVTISMLKILNEEFLPNKVSVLVALENKANIFEAVPFAKEYKILNGKTTAYVCENYECKIPVNDARVFREQLTDFN